jgi:mitogen-activated protein kinase kinase kinase
LHTQIGSSAKPTIPSDVSGEAQDFLRHTFEVNHEDRPDAKELLLHPWVAKKPGQSPLKAQGLKMANVSSEAALT